ncbi:MAG: RnfABCDGE type electron transport complex subunit D [Buchnera aphidicola (Eriosoma harunire)]
MYKYIFNSTTNNIMLLVILALLPGIFIQSYYFGYSAIIQILISIIVSICTECCYLYLSGFRFFDGMNDYSTILSSILFGLCLPMFTPWWIIVIGSIGMIILGKQLYGGLGQNIYNPAMVGYIIVLVSFPSWMTNWSLFQLPLVHDVSFFDSCRLIFSHDNSIYNGLLNINNSIVTQATPLNYLKLTKDLSQELLFSTMYDRNNMYIQSGFFWINVGFLLGGVFLLVCRIICWRISISFLLVLWFLSFFGSLFLPGMILPPSISLFSGATMLGAFFILTDPVTSSTTPLGKIIFGVVIGFFLWIIRSFGNYPDAIGFSVLLGNSLVPLLDVYTRPKIYGYDKKI